MPSRISHTLPSTIRIDNLRSPLSDTSLGRTRIRYEAIYSIDSKATLGVKLHELFPDNRQKVIRDFFINHPVSWTDLLRKLHKYRQNNRESGWYIEEWDIGEIYTSFLIRGRKWDIGIKLRALLPDAISKNQELIEYAADQPSLLDESGHAFSKISLGKRKWHIKKLIGIGMIQNINGCTYETLNIYFAKILPKILHYMGSIFGIEMHLWFCKDVEQLIHELDKLMSSGSGEKRENAFRMIQAFHGWSGIEEIEEMYDKALSQISKLPQKIRGLWFKLYDQQEEKRDGTTVYSATLAIDGKEYRLEWRVKTIKSLLQKMWETEEYTNIDAVKDIIWITCIWRDDATDEEKINLVSKFARLMPDFWYLLKDKGWLWEKIKDVEDRVKIKKKQPIYISRKKWDSTDPNFKNTSLSGYMTLDDTPLGTEIQFYNNTFAEWKKRDDKNYKPRWALSALTRWTKFTTPKQCFLLLNKRVDADTLKQLGYHDINDMMLKIISSGFLKPYISGNGEELLLSVNGKATDFEQKFPTMKPCNLSNLYYNNMIRYITQLNSWNQWSFFAASTSWTSSPTLPQGRWFVMDESVRWTLDSILAVNRDATSSR